MFLKVFWQDIRKRFFKSSGRIEEYEKLLETIVLDMQEDLIKLRQTVAISIATQKRLERQHGQAKATADEWQRRAKLALQKGDEDLAREALGRRETYQETMNSLEGQIETGRAIVDKMRSALIFLEGEIANVKYKKDIFIARVRFLEASESIVTQLSSLYSIPNSIFEDLEKDYSRFVTQSNLSAELYKDAQDQQFDDSKNVHDTDAELEAIKKQMAQD